MRKYKSVDMKESQLEELARKGSELIEEGLQYVDHTNSNGKNRLDALFVDGGKSMVVAVISVSEDDEMLLQGIDHYNYVAGNLETLARTHKNGGIDPTREIRLMLIAPGFSQTLLNRCRWIDAIVSLYTYKCIQFEGSEEVIPIFTELSVPAPPRPSGGETDRPPDRLGYIANPEVRGILASLLSDLTKWGKDPVLIEPIKYAISVKTGDKVFMHLSLRRDNFLVETHNAEGKWNGYPVKSRADLENLLGLMKSNMESRRK